IAARHAKDIETVDAESLQVLLAVLRQIFRRAAAAVSPCIRRARATGLGMNPDSFASPLERFRDQLMVVAVAVARRRVQKIDPQIERAVKRRDGFIIVRGTIHAGHAHAAEPYRRNFEVSASEPSVLHQFLPDCRSLHLLAKRFFQHPIHDLFDRPLLLAYKAMRAESVASS